MFKIQNVISSFHSFQSFIPNLTGARPDIVASRVSSHSKSNVPFYFN